MFSIFQRRKRVEMETYIHRICDLTAPNRPLVNESRQSTRCVRSVPVVIHPWDEATADPAELSVCLTKDISDEGIGLVINREIEASEILIGFWFDKEGVEEPWFFKASVITVERTGAGLWRIGTRLDEFMNRQNRKKVLPLMDATRDCLCTKESVTV